MPRVEVVIIFILGGSNCKKRHLSKTKCYVVCIHNTNDYRVTLKFWPGSQNSNFVARSLKTARAARGPSKNILRVKLSYTCRV